jgi:hypothetical protein
MEKQTNPTPAPEGTSTPTTFAFVSREDPERLVCEAELVFPSTGSSPVSSLWASRCGTAPTERST